MVHFTSFPAISQLEANGLLGIRDTDVSFSAAKMFFSYGLSNSMIFLSSRA